MDGSPRQTPDPGWKNARETPATAALIFDGDDTLWETERLYDQARADSARAVASAGYDPGEFDRLQRTIDARNVETMGLSAERFPLSSVEAFRQLAQQAGAAEPGADELERVYAASAAVFEAKAPLLPNANELLANLHRSFRLALLTKGDRFVQERRIDSSGLRDYFEWVEIVADKDPATFLRVLRQVDAEPAHSWSIGNSLPSDVAPALDAGLQAIWIDAHVWQHERRQNSVDMANPRLHIASGLIEVPAIIASALEHTS